MWGFTKSAVCFLFFTIKAVKHSHTVMQPKPVNDPADCRLKEMFVENKV